MANPNFRSPIHQKPPPHLFIRRRSKHEPPKIVLFRHRRPKSPIFLFATLFQNPSSSVKARYFRMDRKYHILGSCNGVLCLFHIHQRYLMLWNPSIRFTSKRLPTTVSPDMRLTFHGFGYDHVNDKFKLLVVEEDLDLAVTKVFTFGANSWGVIQNFPCPRPIEWHGKLVSGKFNWLANGIASNDRWMILSFDVGTESYGELSPPDGDSGKICNRVLNVLRNCLSLCFYDSKEAHWVVWIMKEYGVQDSWTKFMMIPQFIQDPRTGLRMSSHVQHRTYRWYHWLDPVCISENGGVVILKTNFSKVVLYSPNDGRLNYLRIWGNHGLHHLHIYHESLVKPTC